MGKTYKDSKYKQMNLRKDSRVGKNGEKKLTIKKNRSATKKELRELETCQVSVS